MTFRTIADIVYAHNVARDLVNLATAYLRLWRKYANGCDQITIPDDNFTVVIMPMKHESLLSVGIVYTKTVTWSEPEYYDVDDDNYVETYNSRANICGYSSHSEEVKCELFLNLPTAHLLLSEEDMTTKIKAIAAKIRADEAEAMKQAKIQELEAQIKALKTSA